MTQPLARKELASYGLLALPVAFAGMPLYVLAPDFYATQFGMSLTSLGVILLFLRMFDAVQDPFIGVLSDRFASRARSIIWIAAFALVLGMAALFHPQEALLNEWFALSMLISVTAYSVLSINLNTLGALWSKDKHQRTRITTMREAFGLIGLLIAIILPGILKEQISTQAAFGWLIAVLAVIMLVVIFIFNGWLGRHSQLLRRKRKEKRSILAALTKLEPKLRNFFIVYGVSMLASSIPAVLVLFFIRDRLDAESYTGLFLLLYFASGAALMPLWQKLSKQIGKHRAWLFSIILAVISFVWAYFLDSGDIWQYAIICIVSGSALGADLALPPSILADYVDDYKDEGDASARFSFLTLLVKLSLAAGSAIVLPLLDSAGFVPAAENSASALHYLSIAYALVPCLIKICAGALLYFLFIKSTEEPNHEISHDDGAVTSGSRHA